MTNIVWFSSFFTPKTTRHTKSSKTSWQHLYTRKQTVTHTVQRTHLKNQHCDCSSCGADTFPFSLFRWCCFPLSSRVVLSSSSFLGWCFLLFTPFRQGVHYFGWWCFSPLPWWVVVLSLLSPFWVVVLSFPPVCNIGMMLIVYISISFHLNG